MSDSTDSKLFNFHAYNQWSDSYDQMPNSTVAVDERNFPRLWQHLGGLRVLEIGCGTGRHTAKLVALKARVTAVEISPGMLEIAKAKVTSVDWWEGDFLQLDLPRGFDAALISLVLEHVEHLKSFFEKVASLLHTGGEFFFSEIHPDRIAGGSQANFTLDSGENIRLVSFAHKREEYLRAAENAGLELLMEETVLGDEALAALHPGWEKYLHRPMILMMAFRKS